MEDYDIISKLGCGSYGQALQAKEKQGNRNCVIKEIKVSHLNCKDLESAKKEVKVLSSLVHSHITKFFNSFESNDCLYIVMEYCGGGDLQKLIDSRNGVHFPENRILDWFAQLCLAVRFIHQRHIIHRDIKAQNVFLTDEGRIKLGDFGIAKILDKTSDLTNTCIGTPFYLSPEMCENKPYSNKSDIWAVGCVLYEMAALKHAFDASNMKSLVIKIIKCSYSPIPPRYSHDLKYIIQQIFQRYPKCRPSINSILKKNIISKRLSRFITEDEAMELQASNVATKRNSSSLTKRNALRSRVGISSPAAKYVSTPKMNISYPNVTCSSKFSNSPKVNLHCRSKLFFDVFKSPLKAVVKKNSNNYSSHNMSLEDPPLTLAKNKIKQIPLKKRCYSQSPKVIKTKNSFSPSLEKKSYADKSFQLHSKSDRQSKLNLIINESTDSFKKIDVSSSILSNLNKLESSLGRTDLQHSSGWLLDYYLSKRLINLKNDLKSSEHLSDSTKVFGTPLGLSEILSDIQQHIYSPAIHNGIILPKKNVHDNVNLIVDREIEKACLMAENRRKLAYDEEKHALESTFKSTPFLHTNVKNSESDFSSKDPQKEAIFGNEICRDVIDSSCLSTNNGFADPNSLLKINSSLNCSATSMKGHSNVDIFPIKSRCDGSFFDILNVERDFEEVPSFDCTFQQNRKHWSNGPNDIVSILSSAKLLDGRNSMITSGRHTLTECNIRVTDPICFSNGICDKNTDSDFSSKKIVLGKTYSISPNSMPNHISSEENIQSESITQNDIYNDNVAKPNFCQRLSGMNQNIDEEKSSSLEKNDEIYVLVRTPYNNEASLTPAINFENEVNCKYIETTSSLIHPQNEDISLCLEKLNEHESMQNASKIDLGVACLVKNKKNSLEMLKKYENQTLDKFYGNGPNGNNLEPDQTSINKKNKKKLFSFLHSRCTSSPDENIHKTETSKHFSTPRSKARFSAILRKFLLRESLEKSGNGCKPLPDYLEKNLESEEILEQGLSSEENPNIVLSVSEINVAPIASEDNVESSEVFHSEHSKIHVEILEQGLSSEDNPNIVLKVPESNVAIISPEDYVESSEIFHSEHPLIHVNNTNAALNDYLWTDAKMNVTKDSGVDSSHTYSTLDNGTNSSSLQRFLINDSNFKSQKTEALSDVGCSTIATCSPIPVDIKYISGLEITLGSDFNLNATINKPIGKQDLKAESGKSLCLYSPIFSNNFESTFKLMNNKEHNPIFSNNAISPKCSDVYMTNDDSLRKTAFTIVEDAFSSAIKKLEEKNFTLKDCVNEDLFYSEFKPCKTNATNEANDNAMLFYKFDHHKNVNNYATDASSKRVDKIQNWSIDAENKCDFEKKISTQSTPLCKNVYSQMVSLENCSESNPMSADKDQTLANAIKFKTKFSNKETNSRCKNVNSAFSDSDEDYCYADRNLKKETITEKNSVQKMNRYGTVFGKGNVTKIPSFQSIISDDAQDVTNFRQSLENLLFSGEDEVFEEDALQMSVCSVALEVDVLDGDVHGWIEELRAKLEETLGIDIFMEAYRCLEGAFELDNSHLKEALCHVRKMIGPNREQITNDILRLIVSESVHLN